MERKKRTDPPAKKTPLEREYDKVSALPALFPTAGLRAQVEDYVRHRTRNKAAGSIKELRLALEKLGSFLSDAYPELTDIKKGDPKAMRHALSGWMLKKGYPSFYIRKKEFGEGEYKEKSSLFRVFEDFLKYHRIESDAGPERKKDVWDLEKMDLSQKDRPLSEIRTISFDAILQKSMREEVKAAAFLLLRLYSASYVKMAVNAFAHLAAFVEKSYPDVRSIADITGEMLEEFMIALRTGETDGKCILSNPGPLRLMLEETAARNELPALIEDFQCMEKTRKPDLLYRTYSENELETINQCIMKMSPQYARAMLVMELLGIGISETLTLEQDCLFEKNGYPWVQITPPGNVYAYSRPVDRKTAALIRSSIRYTQEHFGNRRYVFVNEKSPDEPLKIRTLKYHMDRELYRTGAVDDNKEPMRIQTDRFRHTYGQRLAQMGLDDTLIAAMMGHVNTTFVRRYRQIGNREMAQNTEHMRKEMEKILLQITKEW